MNMMKLTFLLLVSIIFGCAKEVPESDALGHFESRELSVSAERQGILQELSLSEGDYVEAGKQVGTIDTSSLDIQRRQILAQLEAVKAKRSAARAQTAVIEEELKNNEIEVQRFEALIAQNAAPTKQLDEILAKKRVQTKQKELLYAQEASVLAELNALSTQLLSVQDQLRKSSIINPISGKVLLIHTKQFEMTTPGRPVYTIANLDTLDLRIYVTGDQLSSIQTGMMVEVLYDDGSKSIATTSGAITRIASQAEFTPKFLQTREERVSLVYAVIVRVPNNGKLNIGMPAEVRFNPR